MNEEVNHMEPLGIVNTAVLIVIAYELFRIQRRLVGKE